MPSLWSPVALESHRGASCEFGTDSCDHLGGRVVDVGLLDDGGSIRGDEELLEMVDDHLVEA